MKTINHLTITMYHAFFVDIQLYYTQYSPLIFSNKYYFHQNTVRVSDGSYVAIITFGLGLNSDSWFRVASKHTRIMFFCIEDDD